MTPPRPPARRITQRVLHTVALATLIALIVLTLTWELWLAPLRPGGSWLALKTLPLLFPVPGILRRSLYTYRWAMMLVLAYFLEGTVRAYAESGIVATLAVCELVLALVFFVSAIGYVRVTRSTVTGETATRSERGQRTPRGRS